MISQELESASQLFHRSQELLLSKHRFFLTGEHQLIFIAHDDGFLGTDFLTESAKDASDHVDLELDRISFLFQLRL